MQQPYLTNFIMDFPNFNVHTYKKIDGQASCTFWPLYILVFISFYLKSVLCEFCLHVIPVGGANDHEPTTQ